MRTVELGVSNFREFQTEAREFFTRSDERARHREQQEELEKEAAEKKDRRRARIHFWWLGLLSALIVAFFTVGLEWALHFEKRHHVSETTTTVSQPSTATHAKDE